jgi:hypothetical protein
MRSDTKMGIGMLVGVIAIIAFVIVLLIGPAGISNKWSAWKASAYGSDWLVVQYAQDGSIITSWELKASAIHSESNSDGIYFTSEGSVKHLSGHYIYVQNPTDADRDKLTKGRERHLE